MMLFSLLKERGKRVCHFNNLPCSSLFVSFKKSFSFYILISAALCGTSKGIKEMNIV